MRKVKKNNAISLGLLIVGGLVCQAPRAACFYGPQNPGNTKNISFGHVVVQRDTPVGAVIASKSLKEDIYSCSSSPHGSCGWFTCDTTWRPTTAINLFTQASGIPGVYKTNLNGIGIKIYRTHSGENNLAWHWPAQMYDFASYQWMTVDETVSLVKLSTAKGTSGTVTPGILGRYLSNGVSMGTLNLSNTSVTFVACSLTTNTINVPLDPVVASSFTGVGKTLGAKSFSIGLSCDAGTRINASLSGTQNTDTTNTSVLALSNSGSAGTAKGIGIQLLYGSTPLKLGENLVLKTSAGGIEFPAGAFSARYYQTKSDIVPGDANTTAILNITYQ